MAVQGLERLKRQLRALPASVVANVSAAGDGGAEALASKIAAAAPGRRLAKSVGWSNGDEPGNGATAAPLTKGQQARATAGLHWRIFAGGVEAFWARWAEFGTAPHSSAKGASRKSGKLQDKGPHVAGMPATPYFFPTVRAWKGSMKSRLTRAGNKAAKALAAVK